MFLSLLPGRTYQDFGSWLASGITANESRHLGTIVGPPFSGDHILITYATNEMTQKGNAPRQNAFSGGVTCIP